MAVQDWTVIELFKFQCSETCSCKLLSVELPPPAGLESNNMFQSNESDTHTKQLLPASDVDQTARPLFADGSNWLVLWSYQHF